MSSVTIEITDLSRSGPGVGRIEQESKSMVVFVPLTAPGDQIRVEIAASHKRYLEGRIVEILKSSPLRVEPPCPVFGKCGGCEWQHIPYELQWKTKVNGVKHGLKRIGIESETPLEEFPAEKIYGYRNRVQVRGQGTLMGFYAKGSKKLVPVDRCEIAMPEINEAWERIRKEGETKPQPYKAEIEFDETGEVRVSWNQRHAALGFRQVNDEQNLKLQAWVKSGVKPGDHVLDLFGGNGNLSYPIADLASRVDCVDEVPSRDSYHPNVFFHRSDVLGWLRKAPKSQTSLAILDPPRIGLDRDFKEIELELKRLGVQRILGIGCDPDAWARDLRGFLGEGWRLVRWGVLDLMPQTSHIESLFEVHSPGFLS